MVPAKFPRKRSTDYPFSDRIPVRDPVKLELGRPASHQSGYPTGRERSKKKIDEQKEEGGRSKESPEFSEGTKNRRQFPEAEALNAISPFDSRQGTSCVYVSSEEPEPNRSKTFRRNSSRVARESIDRLRRNLSVFPRISFVRSGENVNF